MAEQTVGQAVEQVSAPKMISPEVFAQVLPTHVGAEKYTRWCLTLLKDPKLAEVARTDAGRLSIMSALMDCASLGLEPGRTYHLVPFGGKDKEGRDLPKTVTGITDYKGEVELIWRAVQRPVIASLVYSEDEFVIRGANVPPLHTGDWFAEAGRGVIKGGYAYVDYGGTRELGDGHVGDGGGGHLYSQVVYMSEADFLKHRGKAKTKNAWDDWPEAMRLKTLVHQLRKWVPWSAEVQHTEPAVFHRIDPGR